MVWIGEEPQIADNELYLIDESGEAVSVVCPSAEDAEAWAQLLIMATPAAQEKLPRFSAITERHQPDIWEQLHFAGLLVI